MLLREAKSGAAGLPTDPVIRRMAQELSFAPDPLLTAAAEADCEHVGSRVTREPRMQVLVRAIATTHLMGAQIDRMLVILEAGPACEDFGAGGGHGSCGEYNGVVVTDVTMQKLVVPAAGLVGLAILVV